MSDDLEVPDQVRLIRDFVNTREPQVDAEGLNTPDDLRAWFTERQLVSAETELDAADLAVAVRLREGLRAVLMGHAGHDVDPAAVETLNDTLAELPVRLVFTGDGYSLAGTSANPFAHGVAGLAEAIRRSSEDGSWPRLKVCARDSCRWAFYDASRNQVRRWCSMAGCGNHVKMRRAYAARKVRQTAPDEVLGSVTGPQA
jgi:predicted RNA-binding Zn ribbon-like protein